MLSFIPVLTLVLGFITTGALSTPIGSKREYPYKPVTWITHFRDHQIVADSMLELEWTGGSGKYEVYYIPQWIDQDQYVPVDITNTTSTSVKWRAPKLDSFPAGTTFIMVVNDLYSASGAQWYDTTSLLSFVDGRA